MVPVYFDIKSGKDTIDAADRCRSRRARRIRTILADDHFDPAVRLLGEHSARRGPEFDPGVRCEVARCRHDNAGVAVLAATARAIVTVYLKPRSITSALYSVIRR